MKMHRTILAALSAAALAAGAVISARAQTGINSTVEVERDYEGRIVRTVKSPLDVPVDDSLFNFKLNFDYTTFYNPYKDLYEFSPMMTPGPASEGRVTYPWLYARIAAAYPWTPSADVYVTPRLGERFSAGIYVNHDSYWGKVPQAVYSGSVVTYPGREITGDRMKNRGGVFMDYRWTKGELGLDASYSGSRYAVAPADGPVGSTVYNESDHFNASLSLRSTNPDYNSFYYRAALGYRYFNNRRGVQEHLADVDVSLGATIKGDHRLYVTFGGMFSQMPSGSTTLSSGVWKVSPVYTWERNRWRVRAGLTVSSVYGDCSVKSGGRFIMYPDASVSLEAVRSALWFYLKASGDNRLYTRYDLYALNPWMLNSVGRPVQSAVPVSAELGLNGLVLDRFSYSLGVNYSLVRNHLSFIAMPYNNHWYHTVDARDSRVFGVTGMLKWQSPSFLAQAELNYRNFSNPDAAWMIPAFDVDAVLEYNLRHRLFIRADCYFRTSVTGGCVLPDVPSMVLRVPAFVDVGLRISYAVNTRFLVFVEGNNLVNSKIQYFLNYVEPGINVGAGLCLKL